MAMKLCSFLLLVACLCTEAKVIMITLADGSTRVFTSSELSSIDFNDDGMLTVTTYDGVQLPALAADWDTLAIGDEAAITAVYPDTLSFNIDVDGTPVDLHTQRSIMKMNYVYPSTDPFGQPITLSGTILIPEEVWQGSARSEGILMVNHYTKFHHDEAPTSSNGQIENMLLANPLNPNYIIVDSDFYGFGATVRFPQAFMQGVANARASLDGLLAARELLSNRSIDYGQLCFNVGYSSGGYDALQAQNLRDMEYADRISFDKTFAGGSPSDVCEAYRQFVLIDSTAYNAVPLLLVVCTNEIQQLGLNYSDVFQPYISNRIDELILSKAFSSWPICDSIGREKKIHEILLPGYCDLESPQSIAMQNLLGTFNISDDEWNPDPSQRIYLYHSRGDDYVSVKSARPIIPFFKSKGFEPSIIPGKTNLQTNFVVTDMGHLSATLIYFVQTLAAIHAWPQMYTDGKLNPEFESVVSQNDDMVSMMRQLDAMGFDCRTIISNVVSSLASIKDGEPTQIPPPVIALLLTIELSKLRLSPQDLAEMSEDSGTDLEKLLFDLIVYFSEQPRGDGQGEGNSAANRTARLLKALNANGTPADRYAHQLRKWLEENRVGH